MSDSKIIVFPGPNGRRADFDSFLLAMFLMFARAPKKATPDVDGSYSLGEIGTAPEKAWSRLTPYSIARRVAESSGCKCGDPECVGHEIIDEQVQFPGFTSIAVMLESRHELAAFTVPRDEAFHESGEVPPLELAAHPGPFRVRWLPLV